MAWTKNQYIARLKELGHDYLSDTRAGDMIEMAAQGVLLEELWPFRRQAVTVALTDGVGTLSAGVGIISQVMDVTQVPARPLMYLAEDVVQDDRVTAGALAPARTYSIQTTAGVRKIVVEPILATTLTVWHWATYPWTNGTIEEGTVGTEVPFWPHSHRELLLTRARILAYEDIDDYDAATQQEAKYQRRLQDARNQLLSDECDEPRFVWPLESLT